MDLQFYLEKLRNLNGTDLHFIPLKEDVKVYIRTPENLVESGVESHSDYGVLLQKVKIKGGLNISEKRLPQDGIMAADEGEVRISTLRGLYGEALTLRIFGERVMDLDSLGFEPEDLIRIKKTVTGNFSLILITGETGSGKSTTLKAVLKYITELNRKVISIEDPVEISVPGILEVNISEGIGLSYERAVFAALRQDPDIISLGEIRDKGTCDSCIKASLSGHPIISTFHSGKMNLTSMRLKTMTDYGLFVDEVLTCVINQKLINNGGKRKLSASVEIKGEKIEKEG